MTIQTKGGVGRGGEDELRGNVWIRRGLGLCMRCWRAVAHGADESMGAGGLSNGADPEGRWVVLPGGRGFVAGGVSGCK